MIESCYCLQGFPKGHSIEKRYDEGKTGGTIVEKRKGVIEDWSHERIIITLDVMTHITKTDDQQEHHTNYHRNLDIDKSKKILTTKTSSHNQILTLTQQLSHIIGHLNNHGNGHGPSSSYSRNGSYTDHVGYYGGHTLSDKRSYNWAP